ncbi:putative RTA1 domain protein [Aspergillus sclerotiicarbonarius CBS 121057]|uniref:Putative RTA1 domain protein n=1 Tax=Aspergillus sclerotiicarbonarius (strain CBS 121057 / IBT 28362) TaxID=1448318 RepID=A0A319ET53_ASPSB|nr:putative RTA1 domain protein [Aspergillus sclerotiicarbonarius CBS 121057]
MILFAGVFAAHFWQACKHNNLWLGLAFSLGAFGEFTGWLARTVAYRCPYSVRLLEMQLAALIMAPAFTTAGIYGVLGQLIPIIGQDKSPLTPKQYLVIFMTVDFFSLLLQAIGGGVAGAAFSANISYWPGTYTMVAGIIWQLVSTCAFTTLLEYVIYRAMRQIIRNPPLRKITSALMIAVTCMVARGVYRSMELMNGWRGYLFTHEIYACILDALVMFIASVTLNIWNPAALIKEARAVGTEMELRTREEQDRKKRTNGEYQPVAEEGEPAFTSIQ